MTITKKRTAKLLLAAALCIALVFSLTPMLPGGQAHAAAAGDGSSIVFNYKVDGEIQKTIEKGWTDLVKDTDMTANKYLAWDGSAYKVYGVSNNTDAVSIDAYGGTPSGTTLIDQLKAWWSLADMPYGTIELKQANGDVKKYSVNDIVRRAQFVKNATATDIPDPASNTSVANGTQAFLTISANGDAVTVDSDSVTPVTPVTGLTLCTNLDTRDPGNYGGYATQDERYKALGDMPQNIVEITFVNTTAFNVFGQVADAKPTLAKQYTDAEFASIATTGKAGFLQYSGTWTVHGTDKYVRIQDLIDDAGLVFNEGDRLKIRSSDDFTFNASYDTIQQEKYFYGGTTATTAVTANPTEVGAVIAVYDSADPSTVHFGSAAVASTAQEALNSLTFTASGSTKSKRFFIGLSADNATANNAAGSRFVQYVTEVTVIKDEPDPITDSDVANIESSYDKTGSAIAPEPKVTFDGLTLAKGRDYIVTYGPNTSDAGAVIVTGIGNFTGTVIKTFVIDDGSKKTAEEKAAAQEAAATAAAAKIEELQKKLDTANQAIFAATVPAAGGFKVKAGKKQAAVSWKKIATATEGYQIQYALNKKFTKSKKTVKVAGAASVKKTVKSLKKGKTYYFRVRGVAKIGAKTVYTKWSTAKKVKVK